MAISKPKRLPVRSREERNALVLQWSGLPVHVVRRCRNHSLVRRLDYEDAVQAATIGLLRAAELWRNEQGTSFITYAFLACRQQLFRAARENSLVAVPLHHYETPEKAPHLLEFAKKANRCQLGLPQDPAAPSVPDAAEVGERRDQVEEALGWLLPAHREVIRLYYWHYLTLQEVGRVLGVTYQRAQQIHQRALHNLEDIFLRMKVKP